ncbi:hypothetical protein SAMN05421594_2752 [Chryseobacterium oleae]|uniref:Uncharacterized protein n=1 Tax=Chryseobacterium oleae TaxID=491207 RepID=A0A1I4YXA5_CHROL|nr:hypothetical protein [Chryseobacterium oleae]SFN42696.1 hypothetical protein SAMN05421594_2752 [Chryseobacterium oleae]
MTKKKLLFLLCIFLLSYLYSQGGKVGIDTSSPHQKTVLDIVSKTNNTGVLFPRLTTANIASIQPTAGDSVVDGLWVYNTDTKCYNYWAAAPQNQWLEICGRPINTVTGSATLNCTGASSTGTLVSGQPPNGVSVTVPYTAGNGGAYPAQNINSTGVTGLSASITAGNFNSGSGNLVFSISGTPTNNGTATFALSIGGSSCSVNVNVNMKGGQATLNCGASTTSGTLVANSPATGVSFTIPYTAGNGGPFTAQSIASTGVSGLTATIAAGNFNNGTGSLTYTVSGTPSSAGTASFIVNIGGSTCTVNFTVIAGFDLSKMKILALGASPYSVDTGTNGGLGVAMYSPNNFGPNGTVKTVNTWNVTRRNVTSGGLSDLRTAGYKMLIVGYAYDIANQTDLNSILIFIENGGTVLWFSETSGTSTTNLVRSMSGGQSTLGTWSTCTAINSSTSNVLVGDFGDARGKIYGNDACTAKNMSGSYDPNIIDILSSSGSNVMAFKYKPKEFYWFGDGGMSVYVGSPAPVSGNSYPWLLDSSRRPVISTWGGRANVSNSVMLMNIIAKALKNAQ